MTIKFTNNATTTLASGITNVATSLTVASGAGALFPTLSGSDVFYATLANATGTVEIVKVTARSTDTFTIVRGQDGTTAVAWNAGDKVELRPTAAGMAAMAQTANNLSDLASAATARTNLGVTATGSDTTYAYRANNLSDLASASSARTNLGLGTLATVSPTGTPSTSTFLRGDNSWATVSGGVTSVATGNGLQGGTITSSGTLSIAAPSAGSVGSYSIGLTGSATNPTWGTNYGSFYSVSGNMNVVTSRAGTWMYLGVVAAGAVLLGCSTYNTGLFVRVA